MKLDIVEIYHTPTDRVMHEVVDVDNRFEHIRWFDSDEKAQYFISIYKDKVNISC